MNSMISAHPLVEAEKHHEALLLQGVLDGEPETHWL